MTVHALRPRWLRALVLVVLGVVITVIVWWPMFKNFPKTPIEDGRYFFYQLEISKAALLRYRELPLWNAFDCRGIPMWDHPENITASPVFYATLWFPAGVTLIVWNVAHVVLGFVGMWLLARHELKLSRVATFIAASAWAFGTVHNQYAGEHEAFVSFYNAPLLLLMWRRAEYSWNFAVGTGLLLALMVYDGATYPLPLTVVMLGFESVTRFTSIKRALHLAACAAVVGLVGLSVGASRILPIADQFAVHKRVMEDDWDHLARLQTWADMYLLRSPHWRARVSGQQYVLGEYQAYIGPFGLLLVLIGITTAGLETWWMLAVSAALILLMLGHFAPWAPWSVLHASVPPFKSMRVPSRFRLLLALYLSLYMGLAVDRFPRLVRSDLRSTRLRYAVRAALVAVGLLAVGDSARLFTEILEVRFLDPAPRAVVASTNFYYGGADLDPDPINGPRQNRAYLGCRASWSYNAGAALWTGDVPQARTASPGVVVEASQRTHNTFTLDVSAANPGRVRLNTAYDLGWQSNVGIPVEDAHLLALDVPEGKHHIEVRYWPRRLTLGLWLSVLGGVASIAVLLRRSTASWIHRGIRLVRGA